MEVTLVDNDSRTMRDALDEACSDAELLRVAVAFARGSGLDATPALERVVARGSEVRLLAGVDFQLTDLAAVDRFQQPPSSTRVYLAPDATEKTAFHPKVYIAQAGRRATAIVGSSNLTGGGVFSNVEANVVLKGTLDEPAIANVVAFHERLWNSAFTVPISSEFREGYLRLQDRRRQVELSLRGEGSYAQAQRQLRAAVAEAIAGYRAGPRGRCWLLVTSPQNYIRCIDGRVWGDEDSRRIRSVATGDVLFFYIKSPMMVLAAMGVVTRPPYEDHSAIWFGDERIYPHRFRFEPMIKPARPVSFRLLVPQLDLFGRQDVETWGTKLQKAMVKLSAHDAAVLRSALAAADESSNAA